MYFDYIDLPFVMNLEYSEIFQVKNKAVLQFSGMSLFCSQAGTDLYFICFKKRGDHSLPGIFRRTFVLYSLSFRVIYFSSFMVDKYDAQDPKATIYKCFQFSCSVVSDSLRPHGLQYARLPCPSPTPGAYSNSCPLSR